MNIINKFNKLINDDKITNNLDLLYRSSRDEFNYLNIIFLMVFPKFSNSFIIIF